MPSTVRPAPVFTASVYAQAVSAHLLHSAGCTIRAVDFVAVALAILMFAVLLGLVYGIERI
jgi:hypothetical protein